MSNAGDFPGVEFLRILFSFKNRKENSSSYCSRNRTVGQGNELKSVMHVQSCFFDH